MEREVGRDSDVSKEPVLDKFLSSDSVNIHKGVVKVKVEYLSQVYYKLIDNNINS
jgi:hypothetical protein